jgi:hypothetical protein
MGRQELLGPRLSGSTSYARRSFATAIRRAAARLRPAIPDNGRRRAAATDMNRVRDGNGAGRRSRDRCPRRDRTSERSARSRPQRRRRHNRQSSRIQARNRRTAAHSNQAQDCKTRSSAPSRRRHRGRGSTPALAGPASTPAATASGAARSLRDSTHDAFSTH